MVIRAYLTKDARYHARRRTLLFGRLGWTCRRCGQGSLSPHSLHVDHIDGQRLGVNTKVELARLLTLSIDALLAEVQTLCPPCHEVKTQENGDARWQSER